MSNNTLNIYRNNGATGALLDEYERAIKDMKDVVKTVTPTKLTTIADDKTIDEDCRSIQTILSHVVRSGYGYAIYVRKHKGETLDFRTSILLETVDAYNVALDEMFSFNVQLFADYPNLTLEEFEADKKIWCVGVNFIMSSNYLNMPSCIYCGIAGKLSV